MLGEKEMEAATKALENADVVLMSAFNEENMSINALMLQKDGLDVSSSGRLALAALVGSCAEGFGVSCEQLLAELSEILGEEGYIRKSEEFSS